MALVRRGGSLASATVSGSNTLSVTLPTGIQAGDIGIISWLQTSGTPSLSGWTLMHKVGSATTLSILWKVMAASDSGTTVIIAGAGSGSYRASVSVEVWGGAQSPTATFTLNNTAVIPSATAATGSVPLYIWAGYDLLNDTSPPTTVTAPSGWTGGYYGPNNDGLGLWYTAALTGTTAPGGTLTGINSTYNGIEATLILAPDSPCWIAGATAAQDQPVQMVLAGAQTAQDTNLVWTP